MKKGKQACKINCKKFFILRVVSLRISMNVFIIHHSPFYNVVRTDMLGLARENFGMQGHNKIKACQTHHICRTHKWKGVYYNT